MRDNVAIIRARQTTIRNQIAIRNISLKCVAMDSGIPYDTLMTYFPVEGGRDPAQIPGGAIFALCFGADGKTPALPLDLLSLLLPDGFQILRAQEGVNHDDLADLAAEYLALKNAAHHPASEAGVAIGPNENERLDAKVVQLRAAA